MQAESFEIGSLLRAGHGEREDVLEDGPTGISERQFHTPVRAPPVKRKNTVHSEEPGTKKFVMDGDDAGQDILMGELSDLRVPAARTRGLCLAVMGKNLHDVYSNERIQLAVKRESVNHFMNAAVCFPTQTTRRMVCWENAGKHHLPTYCVYQVLTSWRCSAPLVWGRCAASSGLQQAQVPATSAGNKCWHA